MTLIGARSAPPRLATTGEGKRGKETEREPGENRQRERRERLVEEQEQWCHRGARQIILSGLDIHGWVRFSPGREAGAVGKSGQGKRLCVEAFDATL